MALKIEPVVIDRDFIRWVQSLTVAERLEEHYRQSSRQMQLAEAAGVDDWDEWVRQSGNSALVWQRKDL